MTTTESIVRLVDVHKSFGAVEVLRGISLAVTRGEAVCIIGPSGSGKSTLLRCINGLVTIQQGEIYVGTHAVHTLHKDAEMVALRKDVSIVFQQYNLFPHKTALENIMMAPVDVLGQPRDEVEARAHALLFVELEVERELVIHLAFHRRTAEQRAQAAADHRGEVHRIHVVRSTASMAAAMRRQDSVSVPSRRRPAAVSL